MIRIKELLIIAIYFTAVLALLPVFLFIGSVLGIMGGWILDKAGIL